MSKLRYRLELWPHDPEIGHDDTYYTDLSMALRELHNMVCTFRCDAMVVDTDTYETVATRAIYATS